MKQLRDRVAVVTGAGSGIGRCTALELASRGCAVALVDLNQAGLDETRSLITAAGATASVHIADVSDRTRIYDLPQEVLEAHGRCDILVNNAGVLSVGRFVDDEPDDIDWIVGINVMGVVHGCRAFLPVLLDAPEAHIVNVSSMAAFVGIPQNATYSLTKGAIRSFSEALRSELGGTGVGVSVLFPGSTDTNITRGSRGAQAARLDALSQRAIVHLFSSSPRSAASKIVVAIERDKPRVLLGPDSRALDVVARVLPGRSRLLGRALEAVT